MKKGFTLIELLAVIIILAVIALIATPVVLNVVENAKKEADKNSVRGYADSVRLSYAEEILKDTGKPLKEMASLKTQGSEVDCEYVKYDDKKSGTLLHSCKVEGKGNYCYINGYVYEDGTEECNNIINLIMSDNIPYNTPNIYVISQIPDGVEYAQSKEIGVEYPSLKVVEEKYFIKSSETLEISAISKCGSEELPGECTEENVSSLEANTWYQVSGNVTFKANKNMSIEAIIGNNNEYGSKKTYEIVNIDMNIPTVNVTVTGATASIELSDIEGLVGYGVNQSTTTEPSYTEITGTSTTVEWTASEAGNYVVWVKDVSGKTVAVEFTIDPNAFCAYEVGQTWTFAYTGNVEELNITCNGTYKLEVWGAQGGTSSSGVGGKGGYSSGNISLSVNQELYVAVGKQGSSNGTASFNGGGAGGSYNSAYGGSGGGATHIAITNNRGELKNYASYKEEVLIVAGGGGGGTYGSTIGAKAGGVGGGLNGTNGAGDMPGYGASQTAGGSNGSNNSSYVGSFGQGSKSLNRNGAGGGGYYGGGGANGYYGSAGGGGSGYIGGVIDGKTIAGNASMPTQNGTSTMTGNAGNGYAKITLVSVE